MALIHRLINILICFFLLFDQSCLAQISAQLDLSGVISGLPNIHSVSFFRPAHLRYLSYNEDKNTFNLLIDKGTLKKEGELLLKSEAKAILNYFFIGIILPSDKFWVNLSPDSPDKIIDHALEKTDLGRVMLEADVQLKKDAAVCTSPDTPEGKEYWDRLYAKAQELYGGYPPDIPTVVRPWIVPDEIIIRTSSENAYIYKATLKVMLEEDYIGGRAVSAGRRVRIDEKEKALNECAAQLMRELIVPRLTREVNSAKRYAALRQVYYSLIFAHWFKEKFSGRNGGYARSINSGNSQGFVSKELWSKDDYFKEYQRSLRCGEYSARRKQDTLFGQSLRTYTSGGLVISSKSIIRALSSGQVINVEPNDALADALASGCQGLSVSGDSPGNSGLTLTTDICVFQNPSGDLYGADNQLWEKIYLPEADARRYAAPEILAIFEAAEEMGLRVVISGGTARDFAAAVMHKCRIGLPKITDFDYGIILPREQLRIMHGNVLYAGEVYEELLKKIQERISIINPQAAELPMDDTPGMFTEGKYVFEHILGDEQGTFFSISKLAVEFRDGKFVVFGRKSALNDAQKRILRVFREDSSPLDTYFLSRIIGRYAVYKRSGFDFDADSLQVIREGIDSIPSGQWDEFVELVLQQAQTTDVSHTKGDIESIIDVIKTAKTPGTSIIQTGPEEGINEINSGEQFFPVGSNYKHSGTEKVTVPEKFQAGQIVFYRGGLYTVLKAGFREISGDKVPAVSLSPFHNAGPELAVIGPGLKQVSLVPAILMDKDWKDVLILLSGSNLEESDLAGFIRLQKLFNPGQLKKVLGDLYSTFEKAAWKWLLASAYRNEIDQRWIESFLNNGNFVVRLFYMLYGEQFTLNLNDGHARFVWETASEVIRRLSLLREQLSVFTGEENPLKYLYLLDSILGMKMFPYCIYHGTTYESALRIIFSSGGYIDAVQSGDEAGRTENYFSFSDAVSSDEEYTRKNYDKNAGVIFEFDTRELLRLGIGFRLGKEYSEMEIIGLAPVPLRALTAASKFQTAKRFLSGAEEMDEALARALGFSSCAELKEFIDNFDKNMPGGMLNGASASVQAGGEGAGLSEDVKKHPRTMGGIDFILSDKPQAEVILNPRIPPAGFSASGLDSQRQEIQNLINTGIIPSMSRVEEYLERSLDSKDKECLNKAIACIADILSMEEERAVSSSNRIKQLLLSIESGDSNF